MKRITVGVVMAVVLAAGSALAHHDEFTLGTVRITHPVLANGEPLPPGTYELRDTGEHLEALPGQSDDSLSIVEFITDGRVVARAGAEVMAMQPAPVGTSGGTGRAVVHLLKSGDFLRVSAYHNGERYLVHLPVQGANLESASR